MTPLLLAFLTISLYNNVHTTITLIAGFEGIFCELSAIYSAIGQILNEEYGKTIIPLG